MIAQYDKVNTDGVTYRLDGKTITEKHFDFENTIIKELQTQLDSQLDSINAPEEENSDAIKNQWLKGVGGAQKLLPMHILDLYCSYDPFNPLPDFTVQPELSRQFYNGHEDENLFGVDSKLSVDFAIFKGCWGRVLASVVAGPGVVTDDLAAMTALCKVRTNDFIDLKSQLEDQMTPDNHHHVSHI